jgi:hypothetical protein
MAMPVLILNGAGADLSLSRSQVIERRSWSGSVVIVAASASFMVTAPYSVGGISSKTVSRDRSGGAARWGK